MTTFSQRLSSAILSKKTPVLVGIDPRLDMLPEAFRSGVAAGDFPAVAEAFRRFSLALLDVVAPLVACVKPQMAFFEAAGPWGMTALADVIHYARQLGLLVILDGKRNDIGSTAEGYAAAYLGPHSPWNADALTVSPYLGEDSLAPFVEVAEKNDAGLFVLVKTSNPGGGMIQDLCVNGENEKVYETVAALVQQQSARFAAAHDETYGPTGAVVGATYPRQLEELREKMPNTWLLVPGFGAQGGTAKDIAAAFDSNGLGAIINNSRGIIFAHTRKDFAGRFTPSQWESAVETATREMIAQLAAETRAGRLA